MRKIVLLCSLVFLCGQLWAQKTVSGKVLDDKGNPLPGATVQVKGGRHGTSTSQDGSFTITVAPSAKKLIVTSVNFTVQEVDIADNITIALKPSTSNLDEVVVTAYGATKKKAFTGTASVVTADQFKDLQVSSVANVLQGQASGVLVVNSTGQPGENPDIRIRGIGSVNASAAPFIILDGSPFGGNLNSINPNDIASITVLKDASSTALYGSRAANGILQITTKMGKGTPKVNVNVVRGFSKRAVADYKYVNSEQIYGLTWEALRNEANIIPGTAASIGAVSSEDFASQSVAGVLVYNPFGVAEPIGLDGKLVAGAKNLWSEDWRKDLIRTGQRTDVDMSVSGGSDRTRYFFSGGYLSDDGLPIESQYKRYTGRMKVDTKVNDWLTAGINTSLVYSTQNFPIQGGSAYSNVTGWIRTVSDIYPEYLRDPTTGVFLLDPTGKKQFDFGNNGPLHRPVFNPGNPAGSTALNPTTYNRTTTSVNAFGEAQIIPGLKFRTQYAVDLYNNLYSDYYNPFVGDGAAYGGRSEKTQTNTSTQTFTNIFTYDKTFSGNHHLNIVAGMEAYRYHQGVEDAEARGFSFPGTIELSYGSTPYTASSRAYDNRLVSYFGRANYDFTEKYHLSASLRRDGSSRFADSSRWGNFWSVGGAWNINKEDFLSEVTELSDLKLRASYGTAGNEAFLAPDGATPLYFPYYSLYSSGANIAGYSGSTISQPANGNLTWETQKTLDLGVDFAFLKSRLSGSFTYFSRKSSKLLFLRPLPLSSGLDGVNDNIGTVTNKGIEIDLTSVNVRTKSFEWTTSVNFTKVNNKITQLPQASILPAGTDNNLVVGQQLNNFYIREYAGVDKTDGTPMWYMDQTVGGKTTKVVTKTYSLGTRYFEGSALPDWIAGITNTVKYKGFELSALVYINFRGKVYDNNYAGLMYSAVGSTPGQQWTTDILNRWQSISNPGDGKTPRLTAGGSLDDQANSTSTRFLFDDTYLRVRNITLGYNLPKSLFGNAKISGVRVYLDAQNPFTFFKQKGLDPEEGGLSGVTNGGSVVYKTFSAGLNVNF